MGLFIDSTSQHLIDTTNLNNCLGPSHFEHLSTPLSPIREGEVDDLSVLGKLAGGESIPSDSETRGKVAALPHLPQSSLKLPSSPLCSDTLGNKIEGLRSEKPESFLGGNIPK